MLLCHYHVLKANVFIVDSLTQIDEATKWAAVLRGGLVALPEFLSSGGASGACVSFGQATLINRDFWISPRFKKDHPNVVDVLSKCTPGTKWKPCTRANWLAHKKGMRHIGLLSPAESAVVKRPNGMTAAAAYKFIAKLEMENSAMGIAGWQPP